MDLVLQVSSVLSDVLCMLLTLHLGSFHTPPKASAGPDQFVDPDSPYIPPPIPVWSAALNRVQNDSPREKSKDMLAGYYVPHPMTFATAGSLARYLETWLTIRPRYLQHLREDLYATHVGPRGKGMWNALLVMTDEQRRASAAPSPASGKTNRTDKQRREAMAVFSQFFPTPDFATPATLQWFDIKVNTPIEQPDPALVRKIVWELYELSFRVELAAIDFHQCGIATKPHATQLRRRAASSSVFADRSLVPNEYPHENLGLASLQSIAVMASVENLRRVMLEWPRIPSSIKLPLTFPQTLEYLRDVEESVCNFYCQRFFDLCGRAPVVPHRLPAP